MGGHSAARSDFRQLTTPKAAGVNYGCEMPVRGSNWKLPPIGNGSAIFAEPVRNLLGRQKVEEAIVHMSIRS